MPLSQWMLRWMQGRTTPQYTEDFASWIKKSGGLSNVLDPRRQVDDTVYDTLAVVPGLTPDEESERKKNLQKMIREDMARRDQRVLDAFLGSIAKEASLGLASGVVEKLAGTPETTEEKVAAGVGQFLGFLTTPIKLGKWAAGKLFGKGVSKTPSLVGTIAKSTLKKSAELGVASAVSDVTHPSEMPAKLVGGMALGAVFNMAGLINIQRHPILSQALRQAGGRAMLNIVGAADYNPEVFSTEEGVVERVFPELLNTYFLSKGITPTKMLADLMTPEQRTLVKNVQKEIDALNVERSADRQIRVPKEMIQKPRVMSLKVEQLDWDPTQVDETILPIFEKNIARGVSYPRIQVEWDPTIKQYTVTNGHTLAEAYRKYFDNKRIHGEDVKAEIPVFALKTKPGRTRLPSVAQVAALYGKEVIDPDLINKIQNTTAYAYDVYTKAVRPLVDASVPPDRSEIKIDVFGGKFEVVAQGEAVSLEVEAPRSKLSPTPLIDFINKHGKINLENVTAHGLLGETQEVRESKYKYRVFSKTPHSKELGFMAAMAKEGGFIKEADQAELLEAISEEVRGKPQPGTEQRAKYEQQVEADVEYQRFLEAYEQFESTGKEGAVQDVLLQNALADAASKIRKIQQVPLKRIPTEFSLALEDRIKKSGLGFQDHKAFYLAIGVDPNAPRYKDLMRVSSALHNVERAKFGLKMEALLARFRTRYGYVDEPVYQTKELKTLYDDNLKFIAKKRVTKMRRLELDIARGSMAGEPMQHLLKIGVAQGFQDVRFIMHDLQQNTGMPTWHIYRGISDGQGAVEHAYAEVTRPLEKFRHLREADTAPVEEYFWRIYNGQDPVELTPVQKEYVGAINDVMEGMRPLVRKWRFQQWYRSIEGTTTPEEAAKKAKHVFKNQEKMTDLLWEGKSVYDTQGTEALDAWLASRGEGLGVIARGAYIPMIGLRGTKLEKLSPMQLAQYIDFLGAGHLRERYMEPELQKELIESTIANTVRAPLNIRIANYVRQVLNLEYLDKHLTALDDLVGMFGKYMAGASQPAFLTQGADPRRYTTLDLVRIWAHRAKGYPLKESVFEQAAKAVQATMFRALLVKPYVWLRDLFQRVVTVPNKAMVLDPRFARARFGDLPEDVQGEFMRRVSQYDSYNRDQLYQSSAQRLEAIPVYGQLMKVAGQVAQVYPIIDLKNRQSVFSKSYRRAEDYIKQWSNQELPLQRLSNVLGLEKMEVYERNLILKHLDTKSYGKAAFEVAKWYTDNSQWLYKRSEKSLYEMTSTGEALTNLFTWSKGISQLMINAGKRVVEGYERKNNKQMLSGAATIAGTALVGSLVTQILRHVSLRHGSKFTDYGADAFIWEFGGFSINAIRDFTSALADIVTSFYGTPEDQKRSLGAAMKTVDNVLIRQLMPFAKQALAVVEAFTGRSYISPLYEAITKKQITYVSRTNLEGIIHAVLATDPNKSEDTRKWAGMKREEFYAKVATTTNPVLKFIYTAMLERYKYLADLFNRFSPLEAYEQIMNREIEKWMQQYSEESGREIMDKFSKDMTIEERKRKMGYLK